MGTIATALVELCASLNIELVSSEEVMNIEANLDGHGLPDVNPSRRAMILFTSGTTNKPKGVVSTHRTIAAQVTTLIDAWRWTSDDVIPLFLPLHHIHGIINILSCGLWAGACVDLFAGFDVPAITKKIKTGHYNVFMAVPTIYVKLIQHFDTLRAQGREEEREGHLCWLQGDAFEYIRFGGLPGKTV